MNQTVGGGSWNAFQYGSYSVQSSSTYASMENQVTAIPAASPQAARATHAGDRPAETAATTGGAFSTGGKEEVDVEELVGQGQRVRANGGGRLRG